MTEVLYCPKNNELLLFTGCYEVEGWMNKIYTVTIKNLSENDMYDIFYEANKSALSNHLAGRISSFAGTKWEFIKEN